MDKNLDKHYDPKKFENRIYKARRDADAFKAKVDTKKQPFTVVMPPPNITGVLHMGHALDQSLQDAIIRYKRMRGFEALWIPGTDHASIATEVKILNEVKEEGLSKEELGRERFLERAWQWNERYGNKIVEQCKKLGVSADWSRKRFTMDEVCSKAVKEYFVHLYEKGYIYKGKKIINYCPVCRTSLSDAEVEHEEKNGKYWYFRYDAADGDDSIIIATSRPETMFGDVAIAVSPDDDRYKDRIGKEYVLPVVGRKIPLIADEYPDPEKGSGAVKITPGNDPNDFEVGKRHDLEIIECINEDATMTEACLEYAGLDRYECRKRWVKRLDDEGYLVETEDMNISAGECYRCHNTVEPLISEQWFVKMKDLAKPALDAAKSGKLKHIPKKYEKTYLEWLENIRDWCISRQLWWGHRIPAYTCTECGELVVSKEEVCECPSCKGKVVQDEDVLDTWFSSALWPLSTLGWPEKSEDFDYFYPTNVLVTGYDIIFFWVVRMVFTALELDGRLPFDNVYIHGLVRDKDGQKMSKSLGNGIDPLKIIDEYGADALRFMLLTGISAGSDIRYQEEKIIAARNFANKLWNAARFIFMSLGQIENEGIDIKKIDVKNEESLLGTEDRWMIESIHRAMDYMKNNMDKYEIALAGQKIYDLIWNEYCDWYIEVIKGRIFGSDATDKAVAISVAIECMANMLKLLHPFMPYITEEIWSYIPEQFKEDDEDMLVSSVWEDYEDIRGGDEATRIFAHVMEITRLIRNMKKDAGVPYKKDVSIIIDAGKNEDAIKKAKRYIESLSGTKINMSAPSDDSNAMKVVFADGVIYMPLDELVDKEAELKKLGAEKKRLESEIARCSNKLNNDGFVKKAPEAVVNAEKEKLQTYQKALDEVLSLLSDM